MRIELDNGRTAHVRVIHQQFSTTDPNDPSKAFLGAYAEKYKEKLNARDTKGTTLAEVTLLCPGATPAAYLGVSFCATSDNFEKRKGLKTSLSRAFKKASTTFSKADRKKIWGVVTGGKYIKGS